MHTFRSEETMTHEEAEEVVRRFQEAAHSSAGNPRLTDVAEALGTTPEDVARILSEVRGSASVVPKKSSPHRARGKRHRPASWLRFLPELLPPRSRCCGDHHDHGFDLSGHRKGRNQGGFVPRRYDPCDRYHRGRRQLTHRTCLQSMNVLRHQTLEFRDATWTRHHRTKARSGGRPRAKAPECRCDGRRHRSVCRPHEVL